MKHSDAQPERLSVMGLPVHWTPNYPQWLLDSYRQGLGTHVVTLNAEMAMQSERLPELRRVINAAEAIIPDGAGIVLYFRLKGRKIERSPGIEVSAELLMHLRSDEPVVFYGGAPGIADQAANYWRQRRPELAIATVQHGYLSTVEETAFLEALQELQPSVVLVGLGVPRQELWIAQHRRCCPQTIWIGVGGSFDIWSGHKTRAPAWLRNNHLEWLYRLYQEPWRWRRMLALPKFAWKALTYSKPQEF